MSLTAQLTMTDSHDGIHVKCHTVSINWIDEKIIYLKPVGLYYRPK